MLILHHFTPQIEYYQYLIPTDGGRILFLISHLLKEMYLL